MPVPAALLSSRSVEWYTPEQYIDAARQLMDGIELDPASNAYANQVVRAEHYYDQVKNGLKQSLKARTLWCNPPYGLVHGKSSQALWSQHILHAYESGDIEEALLLVNAATEAKWFKPLWNYWICFTDHRIQFDCEHGQSKQPTQGSAFVYFGKNIPRFIEFFKKFGHIAPPLEAILLKGAKNGER